MSKIEEIAGAVERGKSKEVVRLVKEAVDEGCNPADILNTGMIGAMDIVGEKFKNNEIYVPEMLIAARAMKKGVEVLKPYLVNDGSAEKGTMILGTVKDDLHDIGKNLVGMMIESAGIKVIDLGIDVSDEEFVKAVQEHPEATIVGCSALLTTTLSSLKQTVQALNEIPERSRFKIMVGGAPVTEAFALEIGADAYTADAASAAKKAKELI